MERENKDELDITNFEAMYLENCREREAFGDQILTREEYRKVWKEFLLVEEK